MPVVLFKKDPFVEGLTGAKLAEIGGNENTRRPIWGIQVKEPKFASLSVRQISGSSTVPISITDSSAPGGNSNDNHNFILQRVDFPRQEKLQLVETFGDHFAFFYGERPIVASCAGVLLNTLDFNWKNEWLSNYDQFLRGTKCVENRARVYLGFDDVLIEGYIISTAVNYNEQSPYICPFSFSILVTNYVDLSNGGSVTKQEEARTLVTGDAVEYMAGTNPDDLHFIDSATGISRPQENQDHKGLATLDDDDKIALSPGWVGQQGFLDPAKALMLIDRRRAMAENGTDETTALLSQVGSNSGNFPMGTRNDATARTEKSLGTGIANSASVVDDPPEV
jgi:hypothetical protein